MFLQLLPRTKVHITLTDMEPKEFARLALIPEGTQFRGLRMVDYNREGVLNEVEADWQFSVRSFARGDCPRLHAMLCIQVLVVNDPCPVMNMLSMDTYGHL